MSVLIEKEFIILNIQEYESQEKGKEKRNYKKYTCRDKDAPAFSNDFYYVFDFNNHYLEKGLIYNMSLYLNSKKGQLFLVLHRFVF